VKTAPKPVTPAATAVFAGSKNHHVAAERGEETRAAEWREQHGVTEVEVAELGRRRAADLKTGSRRREHGTAIAETQHRRRVRRDGSGRAAAIPADFPATAQLRSRNAEVVHAAKIDAELIDRPLYRRRAASRRLSDDRRSRGRARRQPSDDQYHRQRPTHCRTPFVADER
jgi:hypothetical protein